MANARRRVGVIAAAITLAGALAGCSVDVEQVALTPTAAVAAPPQGLPAVGPAPGSSHWHAAYVFRICDDVLAPFTDDNDPLGIHTHGDGLIHVHPFVDEAGFEQATVQRFGDAVGFSLETGALTVPGGGTWRDGDLCNGVPGRVFVDRWANPDPESAVTRVFEDPGAIRFEADGELYQIAFAPADSPPVVPPSWPLLFEVSNLALESPEPWVGVDAAADPDTIRFSTVDAVEASPCSPGQLPEALLDDQGDTACFALGERAIARADAVTSARAVTFNRQPAVELRITPAFRSFIVEPFAAADPAVANGLVIAVIVDDRVVTAPLLARPSASEDRLILAGGLSVESANVLAALMNG